MSKEKRFSVNRGIQGCLVSLLCMFVLMPFIALVLNEWLELISNETAGIIKLLAWFVAISIGGYCAARQGKTTGWTNALVVGLLAEWYMAARLLKGTSLLEMMDDAGPNWSRLVALALTIPAAIVGGILWENSCKGQPPGDDQSEAASPAEDSEESGGAVRDRG